MTLAEGTSLVAFLRCWDHVPVHTSRQITTRTSQDWAQHDNNLYVRKSVRSTCKHRSPERACWLCQAERRHYVRSRALSTYSFAYFLGFAPMSCYILLTHYALLLKEEFRNCFVGITKEWNRPETRLNKYSIKHHATFTESLQNTKFVMRYVP